MKTLEELRAERSKVLEQAKKIRDGAEASGQDLTEDQDAKINEFVARAEDLTRDIDALAARQDRDASLDAMLTDEHKPQPRMVTPDNPDGHDVTVREAWEDDPAFGFKDPRQFLGAVIDAGSGASKPNNQLKALYMPKATSGSDEHGTYSDPYGGFTVPETFLPNLLKISPDPDPIAGRVTRIPMATRVVKIPARVDKDHSSSVSGGLRVYRRAEADTSSSSRMSTELLKLEAEGLFGISYATEELLSESAISFAALLDQGFRDEFAGKILDERINGTGVGQFEGVVNSPAKIEVTIETNQDPDTIVTPNILNMRARCWGYNNAIWIANQDTYPQLSQLSLAVNSGGSAVMLFDIRQDIGETLLGRPIIFTEYAATLGDANDIMLINWTQYLEGVLTGLNSASSVHVKFIYHEQTFKFWMQNDGKCWWRSALTPKNGSTLSPIVTLAERA